MPYNRHEIITNCHYTEISPCQTVISPSVQWITQPVSSPQLYLSILWTVYMSLPLKVTLSRSSQWENTSSPMLVTLLGIVMLVRAIQSINAAPSIVSTPSFRTTLIRFLQPRNAPSPMVLTLPGIVTLVRLTHCSNVPPSMPVTSSPITNSTTF